MLMKSVPINHLSSSPAYMSQLHVQLDHLYPHIRATRLYASAIPDDIVHLQGCMNSNSVVS
jgi:hypothetical protein